MGVELTHEQKARDSLLAGINQVADMVKVTLGPQGGLISLENALGSRPPHLTKDGVTVAKNISLSDFKEEQGASLARSVASQAVDVAGDGTTTSTLLLQAIANESNKMIVAGMKPRNIQKGIDKAVKFTIDAIKDMSKPITTDEEIANIGTISANGDREVGEKIADAMRQVGKEGIITTEESKNEEFEIDLAEGMRFDKGYVNHYFCSDSDKHIAILDNPIIILMDCKMAFVDPLKDFFASCIKYSQPVLIIAEDFEDNVLTSLITNKIQAGFKICAVKAPMYGDFTKEALSDIAVLTGGSVFSNDLGIDLSRITDESLKMIGKARKVIVTREHTTIINGAGTTESIEERCNAIRDEIESKRKTHKVTVLEERLARLTGGIAVLKVGGATEVAMKERKDRVDDALHATKCAVQEGVVAGGGVTLFAASRKLNEWIKNNPDNVFLNEEEIAGAQIIKRALEAPIKQIANNAGVEGEVVTYVLRNYFNDKPFYGFDASNVTAGMETIPFCDMFEKGIIDPTKVVRSAIETAASVNNKVIDTRGSVVTDKETLEDLKKLRRN